MVQLQILSGSKAGDTWSARRFPFWVGRACTADLRLEDRGVWEQHVEISGAGGELFQLKAGPNAFAIVNGERLQQANLHNGDLLELGSTKLRFAISPPRQRNLAPREIATWIGLAALSAAQVAVIYLLLR